MVNAEEQKGKGQTDAKSIVFKRDFVVIFLGFDFCLFVFSFLSV